MCPSVCNFGRSGERTKAEGGEEAIAGRDRSEMYGRAETAERYRVAAQ